MSFPSPILNTQNTPVPQYDKVITITRTDISLQFLLANDIGKTYKVVFIVNINPQKALLPGEPLSPRNINMPSLGKAIVENISLYDRTYMVLNSFDDRKAEFYFNYEKWLSDSLIGISPITQYSQFNRIFKFSKRVPEMILIDPLRKQFERFVVRKFLDYMESKHKEFIWFKYLLPDSTKNFIYTKVRGMFDWEYNVTINRLTATLKPLYILAVMYSIGELTNKIKQQALTKTNNKYMFPINVKNNLKKFDKEKYKKYIIRKGFV